MKQVSLRVFFILPLLFWPACLAHADEPQAVIPIMLAESSSTAEQLTARDLESALQRLYPQEKFAIMDRLPDAGRGILLGSIAADEIRKRVASGLPSASEGYVVTTVSEGPRQLGVIAGTDARGVASGVYAILRKLGCGFFLSHDSFPPPRTDSFSFADWKLSDHPLVSDRIVFNWHNFLSGCSTWNLSDWNRWTDQSRKMGYNSIMVHAYGNNPMVAYEFNGKRKPVGFLSTTVKGRKVPLSASKSTSFARPEPQTEQSSGTTTSPWTRAVRWM